MKDYKKIKKQYKKEILEDVEKTFNLLLEDSFNSVRLSKFNESCGPMERLFNDINHFYEYNSFDRLQDMKINLYLQKIQIILAQFYEDIKAESYKIGMPATILVTNKEFVKATMEETLRKIKNCK